MDPFTIYTAHADPYRVLADIYVDRGESIDFYVGQERVKTIRAEGVIMIIDRSRKREREKETQNLPFNHPP
jgi:hypothetical protein